MTDTTPRAQVPLLAAAQAQKHVTHNEALLKFDALLSCRILDRDLSAPPASPADGDAYLVKAAATGTWAGQDGTIAYCVDGGWRFYAPFAGLFAYIADEAAMLVYTPGGWQNLSSMLDLQNVPELGVNTCADATNKLAVKSSALLFDNAGGGVQAKVNKNAAGDTAALLFLTAYSGRAEIGLAGDDDLHVKVSPDGASWTAALSIERACGRLVLPAGQVKFPATKNPSSDPNTLDDYEEGSWTPTFAGDSTPGTPGYVTQAGSYEKIGRQVTARFRVQISGKGGATGNITIGGLPYASANVANDNGTAAIAQFSGVTFNSGYVNMLGVVVPDEARLYLVQSGSGVAAALIDAANFSDSVLIIGAILYRT